MFKSPGSIEIWAAILVTALGLVSQKAALVLAVIILIALALRARASTRSASTDTPPPSDDLIRQKEIQKEKNLARVLHLADQKGEITNDDVETTLRVSNATAERYLDELEKSGKLVQVGKTGRNVVYRTKS